MFRWRVDKVTDVNDDAQHPNYMEFHYVEISAAAQQYNPGTCAPWGTGWDCRTEWERESYLSWIGYSRRTDQGGFFGYEVTFDYICRHDAEGDCQAGREPAPGVDDARKEGYGDFEDVLWYQRLVLRGITVKQLSGPGLWTTVREARFDYEASGARPTGELPSRVLTQITLYGVGGQSQGNHLPPVHLSYVAGRNSSVCGDSPNSFEYGRLHVIDNGYGGIVTFEYEHPAEEIETRCDNGTPWLMNYRIHSETLSDAVQDPGRRPARVSVYVYDWQCYTSPGVDATCYQHSAPSQYVRSIVGYGKVVEFVRSGSDSGTVLNVTAHRFYPDDADWNPSTESSHSFKERFRGLVGREKRTIQWDAHPQPTTKLQEVSYTYSNTVLLARSGWFETGAPLHAVLFNHQDEVVAKVYTSTGELGRLTRTATQYEATYGKSVAQYSYGNTRLVSNGSFENKLTHWTAFGGSTCVNDTTSADSVIGGGAASIHHLASDNIVDCGLDSEDFPAADIKPGVAYVAYARVRRVSGPEGGTALALHLCSGGTCSPADVQPTPAEWTLLSAPFAPANTSLRVRVSASGNTNSVFYVDDVWYEPVGATGDEKTAKTWYVSNPARWVVGLPAAQAVYVGPSAPSLPDHQAASLTAFGYDNYAPNGNVDKGRLTLQRAFRVPADNWQTPDPGTYYDTVMTYDDWGNVTDIQDPRGNRVSAVYDGDYHTYIVQTHGPIQSWLPQSFTWDVAQGKVKAILDPNTATSQVVYDPLGRLWKVLDPGDLEANPSLEYIYTDGYQVHNQGAPLGLRVKKRQRVGASSYLESYEFYTGRGLLVQSRSPRPGTKQAVATTDYDALGREIKTYVPGEFNQSPDYESGDLGPGYTATAYDDRGQANGKTAPDGTLTRIFTEPGQVATIDANNHQRISIVDAYNQLLETRQYTGEYPNQPDWQATPAASARYTYDVLGKVVGVDADGHHTSMTYDALGRKLTMSDPDMGGDEHQWSYGYDEVGNLTWQIDANGHKACFDYDPLSRLTAKRYNGTGTCPGTATDSYIYDEPDRGYSIGRRTHMSTGTGGNVITALWIYDERGRVITERRTLPRLGSLQFQFEYDAADRISAITYPTGERVQTTYDAAGQPVSLASSFGTNYVTGATYNARNQLTQIDAGNYVRTQYSYWGDTQGERKSFLLHEIHTYNTQTNTNLLQLQYGGSGTYGYDDVGNVTQIKDITNQGQVQSFVYDDLDRLVEAYTNAVGDGQYNHSGSNGYSYDALGSPQRMAGNTYVYGDPRHVHAATFAHKLNGGLADDFLNLTNWTCNACTLETVDGEHLLHLGDNGAWRHANRNGYPSLVAGDVVQVDFKLNQGTGNADALVQFENGDGSQSFGIVAQPGVSVLQVRYRVGGDAFAPLAPDFPVQAGTWYAMQLVVGDATHQFEARVWKRDDPGTRASFELNMPGSWGSATYRVDAWTQIANGPATQLWLAHYFEQKSGGALGSYRYDNNGNMLGRTEQGVGYGQYWDALNQLTGVTYGQIGSSSQVSFAYDADGVRALRTESGSGGATGYVAELYEESAQRAPFFADDFEAGSSHWAATAGTWAVAGSPGSHTYDQSGTGVEATSLISPTATYGDITATVRVKLWSGHNDTQAGLLFRRDGSGAQMYYVGVRNDQSGYGCGIFEKVLEFGVPVWETRADGGTACKVSANNWHTLQARAIGGRIDMLVDGTEVASWVDLNATGPLAAGQFGLATWDGPASFDDVALYGMQTRSYYNLGGQRIAVRQTSIYETAGQAAVSYLHADHLRSTSLATDHNGNLAPRSRAYYYPFGGARGPAPSLPTDFRYTGGRQSDDIGLTQLGARWYDASTILAACGP